MPFFHATSRKTTLRQRPVTRPQAESLEGRQLLVSAGDLDLSFGNGKGFVLASPQVESGKAGYRQDHAQAVKIQGDGKISSRDMPTSRRHMATATSASSG